MITKEQFWAAYNKYPPTKLEEFFFKYFSVNSKDHFFQWVVAAILVIPFLVGMIGTITNAQENIIKVATIIFACLLTPFALTWIYVWFAHNFRIRKIRKLLGVSRKEYNQLADMYS